MNMNLKYWMISWKKEQANHFKDHMKTMIVYK